MMGNQSELVAWAAGLLEGEGYFTVTKGSSSVGQPRVGCNMTDKEPLVTLRALFGGHITERDRSHEGDRKLQYVWHVSTLDEVKRIVETLYHLMSPRRREQMDLLIDNLIDDRHREVRICNVETPREIRWCGPLPRLDSSEEE